MAQATLEQSRRVGMANSGMNGHRTDLLLSLIIPAYNEASRLPSTLERAWRYLEMTGRPCELVLVDDGSTDPTLEIAAAFASSHANVRIVSIEHAGKAAAVRAGFERAAGEFVAFSDADLATPLRYFDEFVRIAAGGADIVIGSREGAGARRIGEPRYRHVMGRVFNRLVQRALLPGIEDTQCGFKLFRREAAAAILDRARLYRDARRLSGPRVTAFDVEFLVVARKLGFRIAVVPVEWTYGQSSKVNPLRDTIYNALDIARVRLNMSLGRYRS